MNRQQRQQIVNRAEIAPSDAEPVYHGCAVCPDSFLLSTMIFAFGRWFCCDGCKEFYAQF